MLFCVVSLHFVLVFNMFSTFEMALRRRILKASYIMKTKNEKTERRTSKTRNLGDLLRPAIQGACLSRGALAAAALHPALGSAAFRPTPPTSGSRLARSTAAAAAAAVHRGLRP